MQQTQGKIGYLDCFSGVSGDMFLGAIVDAGVSIEFLREALKGLKVNGYDLKAERVKRSGITATKVDVVIEKPKNRAVLLSDVTSIINSSNLDQDIKSKALFIFERLFEVEAKVHGEDIDKVHLHELGGIDCMIDIVGTLIGLKALGIGRLYVSDINLGSGVVKTTHGILPVPAPATAELLKGLCIYKSNIPFELTTPTGAVLVSTLAVQQGCPNFTLQNTAYGAGGRELKEQPNVLRLLIGTDKQDYLTDSIYVVETNIDDMNPQHYEPLINRLLQAGAKDAYLENLIMKKTRPAVKLTVLTDEPNLQAIFDVIFRHTTTIGVRYYKAQRQILSREIIQVDTSYGKVRVKITTYKGQIANQSPEFEDLLAIAEKNKRPLKEVERQVKGELEGLLRAQKI